MVQHRFNYLLVTLILLLLASPLIRHMQHLGDVGRVVFSSLVLAILVGAVVAVSERKNQLVIAGAFVIVAVLLRGGSLFMADQDNVWLALKVAGLVVEVLLFGYTIALIVRYALAAPRASFDMICASLCAYLLIGVLWAQLYVLLTAVDPAAFSPSLLSEETTSALDRIDKMYITALYVSLVTLSTLGYGDVTPIADFARMFAVVEAIVGQFYLAVLVARLVGLHIAGSAADPDDTEPSGV